MCDGWKQMDRGAAAQQTQLCRFFFFPSKEKVSLIVYAPVMNIWKEFIYTGCQKCWWSLVWVELCNFGGAAPQGLTALVNDCALGKCGERLKEVFNCLRDNRIITTDRSAPAHLSLQLDNLSACVPLLSGGVPQWFIISRLSRVGSQKLLCRMACFSLSNSWYPHAILAAVPLSTRLISTGSHVVFVELDSKTRFRCLLVCLLSTKV